MEEEGLNTVNGGSSALNDKQRRRTWLYDFRDLESFPVLSGKPFRSMLRVKLWRICKASIEFWSF